MTSNKKSGFTLIELSIVLVIIGLIIGGVLVGQELIRAAQIRSVISQIEKYNTAVNTFRNKYNGIPGDLSTATTFFSGTTNGDGNLVLTRTLNTINNNSTDFDDVAAELLFFFAHLSAASLMEGTFTGVLNAGAPMATDGTGNFPLTKLGRGGIYPMALNGINRYHIGLGSVSTTTPVFSNTTMSPNEAYQIDIKMDDGVPNSGNVLGRNGTTAAAIATTATSGATACTSAAATYNLISSNASQDTLLCQIQVRMN
jgi:prepilin-type N-terminal cleavage/methylation domain-containing protein